MKWPRLLLILSLVGCGTSTAAEYVEVGPVNACLTDEACGEGGVCYAGACFARKGAGYPFVLEIVPDPSSGPGGGASFLLPTFEGVTANEPELSLVLPPLVAIQGQLNVEGDSTARCPASDVQPSVHVTLSRTEEFVGLPRSKHALNAQSQGTPTTFDFDTSQVAAGHYDVYVEALGCSMAPVLASAVSLEGETVRFALDLPPATVLRGTVTPPSGVSLEGWLVDLVEPMRGRVISTVENLVMQEGVAAFEVAYRPLQQLAREVSETGIVYRMAGSAESQDAPLIRIRPPEGLIAPTTLWDLAAADLSDTGHVELDLSALPFGAVELSGHLEGNASDHPLVTGAVVFSSLSLAGITPGVTASYAVTVPTDERGAYATSLLPGTYRVVAIPDPALPWAITETTWEIGESPERQAGRALVVHAKPGLLGRVRVGHSGEKLVGATVNAVASVAANPHSVLDAALGKTPALPRASSNTTDADGLAPLELDPGLYDLFVRPKEGSNLPWFVQPRTLVPPPAPGARTAVVDLPVPLPILLGGRAYDIDGTPLPNAIVRAYARLGATSTVVQVAETHTARDGRYKLLLPSKLTE